MQACAIFRIRGSDLRLAPRRSWGARLAALGLGIALGLLPGGAARAQDTVPKEPDLSLRKILSEMNGELRWHAADVLDVNVGRLSPPNWAAPLGARALSAGGSAFGPPPELWMGWAGASAVDVNVTLGAVQVGIAAAPQCIPSCGSVNLRLPGAPVNAPQAVYRTGAPGDPNANTQTVALHMSGRSGAFQFRLVAPHATGSVFTAAGTTQAPGGIATSGSGYLAGGRWEVAPACIVAVDLQHFTDDRVVDTGHAVTRDGYTVKARFEQAELVFHDLEVDGGTLDQRFALWQVRTGYRIPVGKGELMPEFVRYTLSRRNDAAAATGLQSDVVDSQVRMIARIPF